jgi:hypothetical protein
MAQINMYRFSLKNRNLSSPINFPVNLSPNYCSWSVYGGCDQAVLDFEINEKTIATLPQYLRCSINISSDDGEVFWWGFINEFRVHHGNLIITYSLDRLANRVSVFYSYPNSAPPPDFLTAQTAWADNTDSQNIFGVKSLRVNKSYIASADALLIRNNYLAEHSFINSVFEISTKSSPGQIKCHMFCRGWFDTFKWQYFSNPAGAAVDSMSLLALILGSSYGGQFLSGFEPLPVSSIFTYAFRDGRYTAYKNAVDLLQLGNSAGQSYYCSISKDRVFSVYSQPSKSSPSYSIDSSLHLFNPFNKPFPSFKSIVGNWLRIKDNYDNSQSVQYPLYSSLSFVQKQSFNFILRNINIS